MTHLSEPSVNQPAFAPTSDLPAPDHKLSAWLLASFHSATDGIVVADHQRQIVLLNREAERIFGYPARRLIGKPLDVLFSILGPTDYWQQINSHLAATTPDAIAPVQLELQAVRASGEEFPISASISNLSEPSGKFFLLVLRETPSSTGAAQGTVPSPTLLQTLNLSRQQANEIERRRLSRQLYDDIGQNLSVLKLDLDWLQRGFSDAGQTFHARVAQMQSLLDDVIVRTKSIASTLRPPLLDDFGLLPAVKWASERFQKNTSITCSLQSGTFERKIGEPYESVIFRVVEEGLLNIERHARASQVNIGLWHTRDTLHVLLRDNGVGVRPEDRNKSGCFGLIAMRQRIYALSGKIEIENVRPSGLEIHAWIPIEPLPGAEVRP